MTSSVLDDASSKLASPEQKKEQDDIKNAKAVPPVGSFDPEWLWCLPSETDVTSVETLESSSRTGLECLRISEAEDSATSTQAGVDIGLLQDILIQGTHNQWTPVIRTGCDFEPNFFLSVMENLLQNPNITSTCLFRADILYDSAKDKARWDDPERDSGFVKWMKKELQPRKFIVSESASLKLKRTVVRKLVPRKPWVDPELCQTVHFFQIDSGSSSTQHNIVVYIPHADEAGKIPFYHPKVQAIAVHHSYQVDSVPTALLELSYQLFPASTMGVDKHAHEQSDKDSSSTKRLQRTALNFLRIVHKHAKGSKAGYTKRVHHDVVVPQKRFQDTYTQLKAKYSERLMETWAEVTDPLKHVFEDLGIAAFLIEIWRDCYDLPPRGNTEQLMGGGPNWKPSEKSKKPPFRGFVDIGCGNGVLVFILLSEGFKGYGFDARNRKSWEVFPKDIQDCLFQKILIPEPFQRITKDLGLSLDQTATNSEEQVSKSNVQVHNGMFEQGTFIISNHADQLTIWTPLLAFLSDCPFISIPCCSHAFSGKLQRFYDQFPGTEKISSKSGSKKPNNTTKDMIAENGGAGMAPAATDDTFSAKQLEGNHSEVDSNDKSRSTTSTIDASSSTISNKNTPEKGSLAQRKPGPSAYAGFSAHVMHVALQLGFNVKQESLRIPSTRNLCVYGLIPVESLAEETSSSISGGMNDPKFNFSKSVKDEMISTILMQDLGPDVNKAARDWTEEALSLIKPKASKRQDAHTSSHSNVTQKTNLDRGYKAVLGLEKLEDWEADLLRPS
jgi:tRNASer (uridine44-2'-O)-methyltransferase